MTEANPIGMFLDWLAEARAVEPFDATAMSLATTDTNGDPSVRMVLLKAADARGFVFYTNLESPKSDHLRNRARAALCFHWAKLQRQVRVEGTVEPVTPAEADAYFATRPRLSQLGAWASRQSQPMENRLALEGALAAVALRFAIGGVPRPPHWSGWRVLPEKIEFWQQHLFRLHDRQRFVRSGDDWRIERLFP